MEEDASELPAVASTVFKEMMESLEFWANLEFTNNCSKDFNCKT